MPRQNVSQAERLTFHEAACVPLTFLTSWTIWCGARRPGPARRWPGAHGRLGVGSAAVQIDTAAGATVIATAYTERKLQHARAWARIHMVTTRMRTFHGRGGRRSLPADGGTCLRARRRRHLGQSVAMPRLRRPAVTCGATRGFRGEVDCGVLLPQADLLLGSPLGSKGDVQRPRLVEEGKLRPVLDAQCAGAGGDAHRCSPAAGIGKVVLVP